MKKSLILLLTTLLPSVVCAYDVVIDGIYYNLVNKIKEAEVTSNPNKYVGDIVIPSTITYEGVVYNVTSIGNNAFGQSTINSIVIPNSVKELKGGAFVDCYSLKTITIPNTIESIGTMAFYNCKSLISVYISKNVTSIGKLAFHNCDGMKYVFIDDIESWCNISFEEIDSNPLLYAHHLWVNGRELRDLVIPSSIHTIHKYSFSGCQSLISITIPDNVTSIENSAFSGCSNLYSLSLPNSIKTIESGTFYSCSNLRELYIPKSITSIARDAFSRCCKLNSIVVEEGNTTYDSRESCNALIQTTNNTIILGCNNTIIPNSIRAIERGAFEGCEELVTVVIPNNVTFIGASAFYQCKKLSSLIIGDKISDIGNGAFAECKELSNVYCYSEQLPTVGHEIFRSSYIEYATLHVPDNSLTKYKTQNPWSEFMNIVPLTDSDPRPTSISTVKKHENKPYIVNSFTPDGKEIKKPQHGLNIVRMTDGTTKKVVVKTITVF